MNRRIAWALMAFAFFFACSKDLTRSKAASLINKSENFSSTKGIALQEKGRRREPTYQDAGVVEGLFAASRESWAGSSIKLSEKGREYWNDDGSLKNPAHREVVEVTGISDYPMGNGVKQVNFTWRYKDLPSVAARYTGQGKKPHEGKALMKLYDDGWRVEEVAAEETAREPFEWTAELTAEAERQHKAAAEAERQKAAAAAARQRYEETAKTPSTTLGSYHLLEGEMSVTDAGVKWKGDNYQNFTLFYANDLTTSVRETDCYVGENWQIVKKHCWKLEVRTNNSGPDAFGDTNQATVEQIKRQIDAAQIAWRRKYPDVH